MRTILLSWVLSTVALMGCMMSNAETFKEGEDYKRLTTPVKVEDPAKIEVREFFWYGCPHCFSLEPTLLDWKATMPEGVAFVQTPAALNQSWMNHAHAFYVAEALGKIELIHKDLFHAIHLENKRNELNSQEGLASFFAKYGIPEEEFNKLFHSFSIRVKVRNAEALAKTYRLTGVPAVVVNGKYVVQTGDGGFDRMMRVVNFLIEKEKVLNQVAAAQD